MNIIYLYCPFLVKENIEYHVMLEKEFEYYIKHQDELVKKFNGRVLVIKGEEVVGDYETEQEAYFESIKNINQEPS